MQTNNCDQACCADVEAPLRPKREDVHLERLAVVAQKTQNAVIITDAEGCIEWVNEGFTRLTGFEYEEVVGNFGYILQGERTDPEVVETIRTTMWARKPYSGEIYNYTKDGTGFWMSISITPTFHENGEVQGFVAVQMDISQLKAMEEELIGAHGELEARVAERTSELLEANLALKNEVCERRRAEVELKNAQQTLRKVIDSVPNGIFVKDEQGRYTLANKTVAKVYGTTTKKIIGKTDADFSTDLARISKIADDDRQVIKNLQEKFIYEDNLTDKSGNTYYFQIVKRPIAFGEGGSRHVLGIATDLTERKQLEDKLRHSQKMESIGQLAAGIAHEINTPTQYVSDNTQFIRSGFADVSDILQDYRELLERIKRNQVSLELVKKLEERLEDTGIDYLVEEIPKAIEQTLEGVGRINKIVKSMRTFAHPGTLEMKPADINIAIESTLAVAHNEWKYVAEMETDFDVNLPLVPCLRDEFNQVILNIIINAVHAISDAAAGGDKNHIRGKITITTSKVDDQWAEIRVTDTGSGIPPEVQSRVFDPFFTTKEVGKGTGQGLAISHNIIVEKHKGQLTFETEPNQGTTFIIRLPLGDESAANFVK